MNRRNAQDAGHSWRKWGDPEHVSPPELPVAVIAIFWVCCINAGAILGLLVTR